MKRCSLKKIVSSFLPLVLLVTLMQVIPVVFPQPNLNKAEALTQTCTSTASSKSGQDITKACDGSSSTVYLGLATGTSDVRIDVGSSIKLTLIAFRAGGDDQTYRNRMVADATIRGCAAADTPVGECTDSQTVSWNQTQLDSVNNSKVYPSKVLNLAGSYRYYYITTITYGEKFQVATDTACTGLGATKCVQYSEIILEDTDIPTGSLTSSLRVQFKD